jgi:hypothetical protein
MFAKLSEKVKKQRGYFGISLRKCTTSCSLNERASFLSREGREYLPSSPLMGEASLPSSPLMGED